MELEAKIYFILFIITFIVLIFDHITIIHTEWKKIEKHIIIITIKKINFVLKNNIKVHPLFGESINSLFSIIKIGNKNILFKNSFTFIYFAGLLFFMILAPIYNLFYDVFYIIILIIEIFWFLKFIYLIYLLFSRKTIAKKLKTISQKLSLNYNSSLFGLEISKKEINEIKHSGSFENIDEANIFLHSIKNDFEIYIVYKPWKDYDLFKGGKQKILLNRDILVNKLNWNKQHARHVHYLMLIYSNYQSEEFYNRNYKENIRYFLELEKYN